VFYRADRVFRPVTQLPVRRLGPSDGWCDAPTDANYNRFVQHPYPASAERLWRTDGLYDVIVVLGHNERPRQRNGGSAIFLHVWKPARTPTAGCVAVDRSILLRLVSRLKPGSRLHILP
jgi:L,D-peptidoglycan transpeptidase YkuD (ErfK/YbiS/YcfS/YnhG family)